MKEHTIESYGNRYAKKLGFYVRKYTTPSRRSAPDDIFAKHGRVFWIEYKAVGAKPTPLQLEEHKLMRSYGLTVYVADSRELAKAIIDKEYENIRWLD